MRWSREQMRSRYEKAAEISLQTLWSTIHDMHKRKKTKSPEGDVNMEKAHKSLKEIEEQELASEHFVERLNLLEHKYVRLWNIKICKEFKKAIRELGKEFEQYGGPTDPLEIIETSGQGESIFMDMHELEVARAFAEKNHINPNICAIIMELSGLMKNKYDRETIGEKQ